VSRKEASSAERRTRPPLPNSDSRVYSHLRSEAREGERGRGREGEREGGREREREPLEREPLYRAVI
jgi:hypothetical protein